jgi:hypothetical protein
MDTEVFLGTELKLNVNIEPIGDVTMDNYEFEIEVYCSPKKSIVIKKSDAIRIDESNYVILIDSEVVGAGDLKCKITAHIPDGDFEDNIRTEVIGIDTGINIVKTI